MANHVSRIYLEHHNVIWGFWKNNKISNNNPDQWLWHYIQGIGSAIDVERAIDLLNKSEFADAEVFIKTMLEP